MKWVNILDTYSDVELLSYQCKKCNNRKDQIDETMCPIYRKVFVKKDSFARVNVQYLFDEDGVCKRYEEGI